MHTRHVVRGAVLAVAVAVLGLAGVVGAATHVKIAPHQIFTASVNGSHGTPAPAVIRVVCPGPGAGQTGHPLPHQTISVDLAPSASTRNGFTGSNATSIAVFFGAPPPSDRTTRPTFLRYGVNKPIPTSLTVPCSGTGVITFVPFPESPSTSRSVGVPVEYANLALAPRAG